LIGWVAFQIRNQWKQHALKWATTIALSYLAALTLAYLFTDNKYIGFFGEYQRRTGFLTYLGLITFFLTSSYIFRLNNISTIEITAICCGFAIGVYGFFQNYHRDFIHWNNKYNPVIGTLGNPDFTASVMAILLIISFGFTFQAKFPWWSRLAAGLTSLILFIDILFSKVFQGLIESIIGIAVILSVILYQKYKKLWFVFSSSFLTFCIFGLFGMLKLGPLATYLYKYSVSLRGDYWRAGTRMFMHHPIFGVGIDRYGANFRQYRDVTQWSRQGSGLVSNAAHSIPIQLAATGGVFVLIAYCALTGFIVWRGIVAITRTTGVQQIIVSSIFAAWLAYEMQSFISIDNIGVAIWGYILGGALVGLSLIEAPPFKISSSQSHLPYLVSTVLSLSMLLISVLFYGAESSTRTLLSMPNIQTQAQIPSYKNAAEKPLTYIFREPIFVLNYVRTLAAIGNLSDAKNQLLNLVESDSKNSDAFQFLAEIDEYQKNWADAISVRLKLRRLDPYNQLNLLKLGEDYKAMGNLLEAKSIIPLINVFAAKSAEAKQARLEFGN
jgi:hypothetical protein